MKNARKDIRTRRPARLLGTLLGAFALLAVCGSASAMAAPVLDLSVEHHQPTVPEGTHALYEVAVSNTGDAETSSDVTVRFTAPAGTHITRAHSSFHVPTSNFFAQNFWTSCAIAGDAQSVTCTGPTYLSFGVFPVPTPIAPGREACHDALVGGSDPISGDCRIRVALALDPGVQDGDVVTPTIEASGGGAAASVQETEPTPVGPPPSFRVTEFDGGAYRLSGATDPITQIGGDVVNQAGARPQTATSTFKVSEVVAGDGYDYNFSNIEDIVVDLPAGVLGNPNGLPTCTSAQLASQDPLCPLGSQVGFVTLRVNGDDDQFYDPLAKPGDEILFTFPLFNMKAPEGKAAVFGLSVMTAGVIVYFEGNLIRDESVPGGYRARVTAFNTSEGLRLAGTNTTVWGVPADPANDDHRSWDLASNDVDKYHGGTSCVTPLNTGSRCDPPGAASPEYPDNVRPFFTLPTSCIGSDGTPGGPVRTDITLTGWQGGEDSASFLSHDNFGTPIGVEDCGPLDFRPNLTARPTTNVADSPSGLDVDLEVPQHETCDSGPPVVCPRASAHLMDTTIVLPEGLVVNPSGANGLDGCSPAQIDLNGPAPARCPDASKVASVQVETPLLDHTVPGALYIADPFNNPFNSLIALYLAIHDPISGTVVKLPGRVDLDPNTGQLATTFEENPQLPFEHFRVNVFGGARGSLRTPATCGTYETRATLTPWSAAAGAGGLPVSKSDAWAIQQNAAGGVCPGSAGQQPNAPSFDAGTVSPIAGRYSPFVLRLRREDGSQNFKALNVSLPQGLTGKLAGTSICSDAALAAAAGKSGNAEKASPSCPASSRLGKVVAGAGAGPAPYYAEGVAYLTGPHKGAPASMAIITPATAGPFDLGTVVIKTALHVNPITAQISAVSDNIPEILQGIPLDVKTVNVIVDRPEFTKTGTSCVPSAITGQLLSTINQLANLEARYQLAECRALGFKPKLALRLKGGTARGKHPQLTAYVIPREGDANIASVSTAFPRSEFLENAHFRTICTRPDFAADNCPAGAAYGTSTVFTPLLDYPLTGNVYLRSSDNLLPDVVPDLRGPAWQPIRVEAAGRVDSIRGGIRTTFDFFPDAPFTRAILRMQGGDKGLLVNSRNICARTYRAVVKFTAHNGARHTIRPKLVSKSCKKNKRRKAKRNGHKRGGKRVALSARASVR